MSTREGPAAGAHDTEVSGPAIGEGDGPLAFPSEATEWIRLNVWPHWMRTMDGEYGDCGCFLFRMCHCELGVCVPCSQPEPRHDRCLTRQHDGRPLGWDMAIYAWTHGRRVADVMIAGRSCRWRCPCGCWRTELPAASTRSARPAATRLTQDIALDGLAQPALFEVGR